MLLCVSENIVERGVRKVRCEKPEFYLRFCKTGLVHLLFRYKFNRPSFLPACEHRLDSLFEGSEAEFSAHREHLLYLNIFAPRLLGECESDGCVQSYRRERFREPRVFFVL